MSVVGISRVEYMDTHYVTIAQVYLAMHKCANEHGGTMTADQALAVMDEYKAVTMPEPVPIPLKIQTVYTEPPVADRLESVISMDNVIGLPAWQCGHCGEYVGRHDKYCKSCGRQLTAQAVAEKEKL